MLARKNKKEKEMIKGKWIPLPNVNNATYDEKKHKWTFDEKPSKPNLKKMDKTLRHLKKMTEQDLLKENEIYLKQKKAANEALIEAFETNKLKSTKLIEEAKKLKKKLAKKENQAKRRTEDSVNGAIDSIVNGITMGENIKKANSKEEKAAIWNEEADKAREKRENEILDEENHRLIKGKSLKVGLPTRIK